MKKLIFLICMFSLLIPSVYAYEEGYGEYKVSGILANMERTHFVDTGEIHAQKEKWVNGQWKPYRKAHYAEDKNIEWIPNLSKYVSSPQIPGWETTSITKDCMSIEQITGSGVMYVTLFSFKGENFNPYNGTVHKDNVSPLLERTDRVEDYIKGYGHMVVNGNDVYYGEVPLGKGKAGLCGYVVGADCVVCVYMSDYDGVLNDGEEAVFFKELKNVGNELKSGGRYNNSKEEDENENEAIGGIIYGFQSGERSVE